MIERPIKNQEMFLAMRDVFYGGEFSHWLNKQKNIPMAALKEFAAAEAYFREQTNFWDEDRELSNTDE